MVAGHLAVSFAAKRATPATSLAWLVLAANFVDLLWPLFLLTGWESVRIAPGITPFTPLEFVSYPWTHSLLMGVLWGGVLGSVARAMGVTRREAVIIAALVPSHWVLDFITHVPDLTLWPGGTLTLGLGLWRSVPGSLTVEGLLWIAGLALYLRTVRPRGAHGWIALGSFVLMTTFIWVSGPFTPPPPDARSLAWFALMGWCIVPWAWWVEKTSEVRT